jgi:hypothetical protein
MIGDNMKSTIRRILKEDVHQKMLDKMTKMVKLPYYYFLKKNGITDDDAEIILTKYFKDKFGDGKVTFEIKPSNKVNIDLLVKSDNGNTTYYDYSEYGIERGHRWLFKKTFTYEDIFDVTQIYWMDSDGNKEYYKSRRGKIEFYYDNYDLNNWNDYHDVDEFFNLK